MLKPLLSGPAEAQHTPAYERRYQHSYVAFEWRRLKRRSLPSSGTAASRLSVWLARCCQARAREFFIPQGKREAAELRNAGLPSVRCCLCRGSSKAPKQQQHFATTTPRRAFYGNLLSRTRWENHQKFQLCCTLQLKINQMRFSTFSPGAVGDGNNSWNVTSETNFR